MSSETPPEKPQDRTAEPFTRGRIQWSRPPQTVFRVGPLPRSGMTSAPGAPARPAPRAASGILTGTMVPPARSAPPSEAEAPKHEVEAAPVAEAGAVAPVVAPTEDKPKRKSRAKAKPEIVTEPEVVAAPSPGPEVEAQVQPDVVPDPEPPVEVVIEPDAVVEVPVEREIIVEPETLEPSVTVPPPLSSEAQPTAQPRSIPSVVVTPAIYATMGAAIQKATKTDRWMIVVVIVAIIAVGGFIWLATLPAPGPIDDPATSLVADDMELVESPLIQGNAPTAPPTATARESSPPASATPARASGATVEPAAPRRTAPVEVSPRVTVPPATVPQPYIETAPLVVETPTPAVPPPSNPDAPIATRPQPLD